MNKEELIDSLLEEAKKLVKSLKDMIFVFEKEIKLTKMKRGIKND